ncbi:hypothetical protein [Desulfosporosinus sp. Sb-LF]|uniref:hypothetical protein n=1 Tax=Desulfosporosinus sp. Sb-LF TaxID=2560027 RepID=UPI00107F4931|nr:hypothetical protein [Desulfosporosinus sp. Sb-LF]TGE34283.1 hypothetical protein E4K68_00850 [Desulfosporosinus sp. Sb-LF]
MYFLKTIFSKKTSTQFLDTIPAESKITSNDSLENTSEPLDISTPSNLMRKFFHKRTSSPWESPENPYDNETWAPETESVGLFRKHRVNSEE